MGMMKMKCVLTAGETSSMFASKGNNALTQMDAQEIRSSKG